MVYDINLLDALETDFVTPTSILGNLSADAKSCVVVEEKNGEFELTLEYPVYGEFFQEIQIDNIIFVKPNPYDEEEPFRIYRISSPLNGFVTVSAHHISYDLVSYIVEPFSVERAPSEALAMISRAVKEKPWNSSKPQFNISSGIEYINDAEHYELLTPCNARALICGNSDSIVSRYGGELKYNRWNITLEKSRGTDRGVIIEYGKNLLDLQQEEEFVRWSDAFPFYYKEEGEKTVYLDQSVVKGTGKDKDKIDIIDPTVPLKRTYLIDLSNDFDETPSNDEFIAKALEYETKILEGQSSRPLSLTVSFAQLGGTSNYEDTPYDDEVHLCDTVTIINNGVEAKAQCISTKYDALSGRYIEIQLGEAKASLSYSIADQSADFDQELDDRLSSERSYYKAAVKEQTDLITGNRGGYVVLNDSDGDTFPDRLLVMDNQDIGKSRSIWQFNKSGLGYSETGINGPYILGLTMDGHINGKLLSAETVQADQVLTGYIQDKEGINYWNLETGEFRLSAKAKVGDSTVATQDDATKAANDAVGSYDVSLGQKKIFDKLTNNGELQGLFMENGKLYINGTYIATGMIADKNQLNYWNLETGDFRLVGTTAIGDGKTLNDLATTDQLSDYVTGDDFQKEVKALQTQTDKKAETWYQSNDPATAWTDTTTKSEHIGDMWYCTNASDKTHYQKTWRWTGTAWEEMKTTPPQEVFDKIDGKAQIFISKPTPPYFEGDLWFDSASSDIMTCIKTRKTGSFVSGDWQKRNKYIDKEVAAAEANSAVTAQTQTDIFMKLTNNGKAQGMVLENNQLYINATYINSGYLGNINSGNYWNLETGEFRLAATTQLTDGTYIGDFVTSQEALNVGANAEKNAKAYADTVSASAAEAAVKRQTQLDIFNKLTNNGKVQGLTLDEKGNLYINATYIATGIISSKNGKVYFDLDGNELACSRLVSANVGSDYPAATLIFGSGEYSGGGSLTYLRLSLDGDSTSYLDIGTRQKDHSIIESSDHGLVIKGARNTELILGAKGYYNGDHRYIGMRCDSSYILVATGGAIHIQAGSNNYIHMSGKIAITAAQIPSGSKAYDIALDSGGNLIQPTSSKRYKEIQRPMTSEDVDKLYNITPVMAKYKDDFICDGDERKGVYHPMFIAEDVNDYAPYIVDHEEDGQCRNWEERIMLPCMFQMIKDLKAEVDSLKKQIETMKAGGN